MSSDMYSLPSTADEASQCAFGREAAPSWYVVRTRRHKERQVQTRLAQMNVATYLPLLRQWPPPAVGSEVGPMFPCYVFLRAVLPTDFHRVSRVPGVHSFVAAGGEPARLQADAVAFLRSREGTDGTIRAEPPPPGRPVRIVKGPLRGLVAVVEHRLTARQRVSVLLDIIRPQTRVELPESWVRRE
jgi:transcription antitermination factor NusG